MTLHPDSLCKESKENLKLRIGMLIRTACTSNPKTCCIGYCGFNKKCYKPEVVYDKLPNKRIRLKSILKNFTARINRQKKRANPFFLGTGVHEIANTLTGCNIYEHELIKGCNWAISSIKKATTLSQITEVFDARHKLVHGRSKLWNYNPKLWRRYGKAKKQPS